MKTLNTMKKLTLTLLALACALTAQTATAAVHEMKSKDYIRVTIPEASLADAQLVYAVDGNKVEAKPSQGEIVTLFAATDDFLGEQFFSAQEETENSFLFQMTGTNPGGASHFIKFKSSGEQVEFEGDAPIYLNAVDAKVEIISGGSLDEIVPVLPDPIVIDAEVKDFSKLGYMEMRFVVEVPQPDPDQNPDGGNDGDNGGNAEGEATSGGCAMVAGATGGSTLSLAGCAVLSALSLALRRRSARK